MKIMEPDNGWTAQKLQYGTATVRPSAVGDCYARSDQDWESRKSTMRRNRTLMSWAQLGQESSDNYICVVGHYPLCWISLCNAQSHGDRKWRERCQGTN